MSVESASPRWINLYKEKEKNYNCLNDVIFKFLKSYTVPYICLVQVQGAFWILIRFLSNPDPAFWDNADPGPNTYPGYENNFLFLERGALSIFFEGQLAGTNPQHFRIH